jgi:transposase
MTRAVRPSNTTRTTLAGAEPVLVTGGVDTHKDTHTAAAVDGAGRVLGTAQFPATHAGYRALLAWLRRHADDHGQLALVGVEGTGAYGAGLTRHLQDEGVRVVEVDRPDRKTRRFQGSRTRSTRSRQRWRRCQGVRTAPRKTAPGRPSRSGCCGSLAAAPSGLARR